MSIILRNVRPVTIEQAMPELLSTQEDIDVISLVTAEPQERDSANRIKRILAMGALMLVGTVVATERYEPALLSAQHSVTRKIANLKSLPLQLFNSSKEHKLTSASPSIPTPSPISRLDIPNEPNPADVKSSVPMVEVSVVVPVPESQFINHDRRFATTPSFLENFTSMSNGPLNPKLWNTQVGTGFNNEAQFYTDRPTNIRIQNGSLVIQANKESYGGQDYTSARIDTKGKAAFRYGKIDIVAKLPAGIGTWPSLWLLPATDTYDKLTPSNPQRYLNGGEIDIAEAIGKEPNTVYGIAHTLSAALNNPDGAGYYNKIQVPNNNTNFNVYGLEWTPTSLVFSINNVPYYTYKKQPGADYKTWPFDKPFYLILNNAVGGTWAKSTDEKLASTNGIDNNSFPATMQVQSIAYYPYQAPKTVTRGK